MNRLSLLGAGGASLIPFPVPAVNFDGTNDYLSIGAGWHVTDAQLGTISWWFNPAGDGTERWLFGENNARHRLSLQTNNKLRFLARNSTPSTLIDFTTTPTYLAGSGWHHVHISYNLATPVAKIYVDGAVPGLDTNTVVSGTIQVLAAYIGAHSSGTNKWNGDMAEPFFIDQYADPAVEANRLKFRRANGKPEDLGADGSTPFGSQARVYLHNATATWQNNLGTIGNFTENGALTDAATSPSD